MAKPVPAINEPFVGLDGKITDVWYKYLLSLGYSDFVDDNFVHKTGDETIDGNKTLTGITTINNADIGSTDTDTLTVNTSATIPAPTTDNNPATKKYVDDAVASSTGGYHPDLFAHEWDDHIRNNVSWLRADTFSWQSGIVYESAYQHLVNDVDGKTIQTETVEGITIQYYLADDKHKICPASEETNVLNLYNSTGVAWYYILDTVNQRFKLPRTKFGFVGVRDNVGNYVEPALPNIIGGFDTGDRRTHIEGTSGAFYKKTVGSNNWGGTSSATGNTQGVGFDASLSNSIYKNGATVQQKATQHYLYFYVGNFTQTALENTAGIVTEEFINKADTDLGNITSNALKNALIASGIIYLKTAYRNGSSGYNIYSNGYCEQWGTTMSQNANITFLKTYNGVPVMTWGFVTQRGSSSYDGEIFFRALSQSGFTSGSRLTNAISPGFMWKATGYLPDGTY